MHGPGALQYKDGVSHCGDKTILQVFYLYNGIPYTAKKALILIQDPRHEQL